MFRRMTTESYSFGSCAVLTGQFAAITEEIKRFQVQDYEFAPVFFIQDYLRSVKYREELLKLIEDENYRSVPLAILSLF
jgi:hypothetical protein